jgi:hypothetical protein
VWLTSALLALVAAVTGQFLAARFQIGRGLVARFLLVGGTVGCVMVACLARTYGSSIEFWAGMLVYAFACELYIFLGTLVDSSVSVSLLLALRHGSASRAELDRRSSGRAMVASRLERLCESGLLGHSDDGYTVTRRARWLLRLFRALRFFFHRRTLPTIGGA